MLVYLVAILEALAYLSAVPLCAAISVSTKDGLKLGFGIGAFESRFALRRAMRGSHRLMRRRKPEKRSGGRFAWRVLTRLRGAGISLRGSLCLGDAAATALACGALRALASALGARTGRVEVDVAPRFDAEAPQVELRGMIHARAGQIIAAAARSGVDNGNGRIAQWIDTRLKAS